MSRHLLLPWHWCYIKNQSYVSSFYSHGQVDEQSCFHRLNTLPWVKRIWRMLILCSKRNYKSPNSKVCCFGLFLLNSHLHNNGNVLCIKAGLYHYFVHVAQMFYIYSFVKVKVDNRLLNAEDMIVQTLYSILLLLLIMNRRVPQ